MKNDFIWYFRADEKETKNIWNNGLLTLDANVLLDLYRYHESTRNSILSSLQAFKGRLWLSHQTAEEFFRNRAKVIVGSSAGFKQASEELSKLTKNAASSIEQLQSNRIISASLAENLNISLTKAIEQAEQQIEDDRKAFPNFLEKDPILEDLIVSFEGAVGKAFDDEELKAAKTEGERRKKAQVPPGYMDDHKDGDRPFGDYFMWRQILNHAKSQKRPMILVTSERKEDWWERPSGRTVGPRQELLKEAFEYSEQRIMIYQTDRFLQFSAEQAGDKVDEKAVEEIRAVSRLRNGAINAVEVIAQNVEECSVTVNSGELIIELKRTLFNFTASGHFDPPMLEAPNLRVDLITSPLNTPNFRIGGGTGTNHDFNVHLKSQDVGTSLPAGVYVFKYSAECNQSSDT